jgi:cobalt-precorrin-5B (C1)-methyltransferase
MNKHKPQPIKSGYTLPVFAVASAMASLIYLKEEKEIKTLSVELIKPEQTATIKIEQVAKIEQNKALAITLSDPGDNLDITRHTPVWAMVEIKNTNNNNPEEKIIIKGGEGIGKKIKENNQPAIYNYAKELMIFNLKKLLKPEEKIIVTIILPQGKQLAKKTSNEAFGVVEGLSLLGTTGISQALTSPAQLDQYLAELNDKVQQFKTLVFCIGENGLNLGKIMGIKEEQLIKTANWLSPMLIQASVQSVENILLLGYHGKLIKLAGGIFHTHHHLADGRREILTAHSAKLGLPNAILQEIFNSETAEDALNLLRNLDTQTNSNWVKIIYDQIALTIDQRTETHIQNHSPNFVRIGCLLFDRQRKVIVKSSQGTSIFTDLCYNGLNF